MMAAKYVVQLDDEEREQLVNLAKKGKRKVAANKRLHAQILLKADEGPAGPAWIDTRVAEAFDVHPRTVCNVRRRFVEEGLEAALNRRKQVRPSRRRLLDGEAEARLVAIACGAPPEGRTRWTLHLLADRLVELRIVDSISHETVRQTLKKTT
jgi:transposase